MERFQVIPVTVELFALLAGFGAKAVSPPGKIISVSAEKHTVRKGDTVVLRICLGEPNKTGADLTLIPGSDYFI